MNIVNFTAFSVKNIGKKFKCKKSKIVIGDPDYIEYKKGANFFFSGFICTSQERTVLLSDFKGEETQVDWREFPRYFVCSQT